MMKRTLIFVWVVIVTMFSISAQYRVDSMCGAKVILDANGKLLSRYEPQTPGVGYIKAVNLAVDFWKKCPLSKDNNLPLYLSHCSMYRDGKGGFYGSAWPHNPIVVNAQMVQSFAIDWRNFSGDNEMIDIARKGLDHQLEYGTTPANWEWASVPYASSEAGDIIYDGASQFDTARTEENIGRGDGSYVLEADKIGDMGMAYLLFYQITNEIKYLNAALDCADALAKHVRVDNNKKSGLDWTKLIISSPWPFRVHAETGEVTEDYTSHVVDNLRLIEELIRIKDIIKLPNEKLKAYQNTSDIVWNWLYSSGGPMKTFIWKGYFEDIRIDNINLNRVNNSPMEFARFLIKNPSKDANITTSVPTLIWWVKNTFGEPGMNAINEQTGCYLPMGSHTARYASICALWYEYTGDIWFKEEAYRNFNHASYMVHSDGVVDTGHNWGAEIWFSDGYVDYIRHFMEGVAAIPEWAPAGNHLLKSSSVVQTIDYQPKKISFRTFDNSSKVTLRVASKPRAITVDGINISMKANSTNNSWTYTKLKNGGVVKLNYNTGNTVIINQ